MEGTVASVAFKGVFYKNWGGGEALELDMGSKKVLFNVYLFGGDGEYDDVFISCGEGSSK